MTLNVKGRLRFTIIPYQELLGNYDRERKPCQSHAIIPYQELLGNYDTRETYLDIVAIIPYQELLGNYDYGYATH